MRAFAFARKPVEHRATPRVARTRCGANHAVFKSGICWWRGAAHTLPFADSTSAAEATSVRSRLRARRFATFCIAICAATNLCAASPSPGASFFRWMAFASGSSGGDSWPPRTRRAPPTTNAMRRRTNAVRHTSAAVPQFPPPAAAKSSRAASSSCCLAASQDELAGRASDEEMRFLCQTQREDPPPADSSSMASPVKSTQQIVEDISQPMSNGASRATLASRRSLARSRALVAPRSPRSDLPRLYREIDRTLPTPKAVCR